MNSDEILSMYKCDCPRYHCDYFAPGEGEYGVSYSRKDVKELLKDYRENARSWT